MFSPGLRAVLPSFQGSRVSRKNPEDLLVQCAVIIPRIHITRNIRRTHGKSAYLVSMGAEECFKPEVRIQTQQLFAKAQINQDRMTTSPFKLWNDELVPGLPLVQKPSSLQRREWPLIKLKRLKRPWPHEGVLELRKQSKHSFHFRDRN